MRLCVYIVGYRVYGAWGCGLCVSACVCLCVYIAGHTGLLCVCCGVESLSAGVEWVYVVQCVYRVQGLWGRGCEG